MVAVPEVRLGGGGVDVVVERQLAAREAGQAVVEEAPLLVGGRPGTRLVVAIAPGLTIGLVRPSALCSIAASELNGLPWR